MDAIILAGGRGERLMPLTADRPKCMVEVAGRPIVLHQLHWLARNGVQQVVISCGYRWRTVERAIGSGADAGIPVSYAPEEVPLGRGGGLRNALRQLRPREPFIVCNGDLLTALPLRAMARAHKRSGAMATLLLVPAVSPHDVADVDEQGRITGFREKPPLPYCWSGGVYVLSPEIERLLPRRGDHESITWPRLAAMGELRGYRYAGFWQPIDSAKDLSEAERKLRRRKLAG
jgi:NDP-sugar pyrophosphorylase family protein